MKILKLDKSNLWKLFLMAAFPTHVWTILLIFQDYSWVTERNNSWDAIGVGAYGLLAAFAESVFVFVIALLLSFLLPRQWSQAKRLTILSGLIFIVALAEIFNQLFFMLEWGLPAGLFTFLIQRAHPLWYIYGALLAIITPALMLLIYFSAVSEKFTNAAINIVERLSLLTTLYLLLDLGGLVVVIIRNV